MRAPSPLRALRSASALLLALTAPAWAAIGFDSASQSANNLTSAPFSWTHTVQTDSDTVVVVGVIVRGDATNTLTISATYAGRAVTEIRQDHNSLSNGGAFSWLGFIQNPGAGPALITVDLSSSFDEVAAMAISLTGVAPTGQPASSSGANEAINVLSIGGPVAVPVTGSWVVDVMRIGSSPASVTPRGSNPTQIPRATATTTNMQLWASAEGPTSIGVYDGGWTWTNNTNSVALTIATFAPFDDGGTLDGGLPDGGAPGRSDFLVGCGCSGAPQTGAWFLLLALACISALRREGRSRAT